MSEQRKLYCPHGTFPDHCGACRGQLIASFKGRLAALEKENKELNSYNFALEKRISILKSDVEWWKKMYRDWQ